MEISDDYQSALDYIFSYVDFSKTHAANLAPENFDLRRMFDLLQRLGNPHNAFPSVHIAGTKGKGSTAALCSSVLTSAGYKTGLYTSPHLQDFSERIQINGIPIAQNDLVALLERLKPHIESVPRISTFEIMTTLAFQYFADQKVDFAVLEVGLGGRLDATNVITPIVSVITSISLDHTPILGTTITEIAGEKAGIIKPNIPVIAAPQQEDARQEIKRIASQVTAPVRFVDEVMEYKAGSQSLNSQELMIKSGPEEWTHLSIPLLGLHQVENAATAWAALKEVQKAGFEISKEAMRDGFAEVHWPGRFEILQRNPYVILDAAHNADSAHRLVQTLVDFFPGKQMTVIFGASGDKAVTTFLKTLKPITKKLISTRAQHPRAMEPGKLTRAAAELGMEAVTTQHIEKAIEIGLEGLSKDDILLVTGSVFVVGAAREAWKFEA